MMNKMGIKSLLKGEISLDELLHEYNATIIDIDLPYKINGCVFHHMGIYVIFIKKYLSDLKRWNTIQHELAHIELNQLGQYDNYLFNERQEEYEEEVDKYLEDILKKIREEI